MPEAGNGDVGLLQALLGLICNCRSKSSRCRSQCGSRAIARSLAKGDRSERDACAQVLKKGDARGAQRRRCLFQALLGPHSPKPVRYSPTGDSHWAKDTDAGRISREITGGESSNRTGRVGGVDSNQSSQPESVAKGAKT